MSLLEMLTLLDEVDGHIFTALQSDHHEEVLRLVVVKLTLQRSVIAAQGQMLEGLRNSNNVKYSS